MLRWVLSLPLAVSLVTGCASVEQASDDWHARLAAARADARTSAAADTYSQFLIARYASLINDPAEAARKYALVTKTSPEDSALIERAVFASLLANEFDLAASIAREADAETLHETSLARLTLAADAFSNGQTGSVAAYLEGEPAGAFNTLIMTALEAWAHYGEGKDVQARLTLLDAASGDAYLDGLVLNLLGLMEMSAGDDASAKDTFSKVEANNSLIAPGAAAYARLLARDGQRSEALAMLERFRQAAGNEPSLLELTKALESGQAVPVQRLTAQQGAALSVFVPAAALANQARNDLPGIYYAIALQLDPDLQAARSLWAETLDHAGRESESISMLKAIPEDSPYYTSARGQLARALTREHNDREALQLVYTTLEGAPERDLKIQMGDLLRALGRDGEAVRVYGEVIREDETAGQNDWRLYYARGATLERLGQWPRAEADLEKALQLNPDSPEVLNYLGYSWVDRGVNLERGLDLIRKALTLRPDSGAITDSLGWAHYQLGDYDTAVGYLERAAELEPGLAEINDHLGDAYWMAGRKREARFQWQRTISLLDNEDEIEVIERKLLTGPPEAAATTKQP